MSEQATTAVTCAGPSIPDYELLHAIGRGAYGEVWLARNLTGSLVALKIVRRAAFDHDRPFEREFEGIQRFEPLSRSDPSQVSILHVGRGDGFFYYVMQLADDAGAVSEKVSEWVSGQKPSNATVPLTRSPTYSLTSAANYQPLTLKRLLNDHGALPINECLAVALSLTRALAHLHGYGLVHRDVKPSNVIFVGGVAKLADIGLVTSVDATRSFVGTEGYLPPEGAGTPQADLYSLGKVLYEMSTGCDRKEFPALPPDIGTRPDRDTLAELNAIVVRACQLNPRERYASAEAMQADLRLLAKCRSVRQRQAWQLRARLGAKLGLAAAVAAAAFWLLFPRFHASTLQRSNASTAAHSIFVLPFRNEGTNHVDEILRSRITDALIDGLGQIEGVKVGPRRIGLQHRSKEEARRQALKEFNARHTLAGTVRTSGDQVSITLGFRESAQNRLLWSESFVGALTNLPLIESRVVRRIAASLGTPLPPEREQEVSAKLSRNQSAYDLYQRAFRVMETNTEHRARSQMFEYLNRASDLDANFVQAYTALALVHRMAAYSDRSPREAMTDVRKCALRAIEIDESFADGHYWLAGVKASYDYDWPGADAEFRRAFELAPGQYNGKALYLRCLGRNDAARAEQEKAMQESPPWGYVPDESLWQFLLDERFDRALEVCRDMVRKQPNEPVWRWCFGQCYRRMGRYQQALEELEKARPRWNPPTLLAEIGIVYALMERKEDALAILQKMNEQAANRWVSPYFKAQIHATLGDKERALDELEKAYEDRCEQLINVDCSWGLRTDPSWKGMESEPRFVALLKKVGLDVWPR